MPNAWSSLVNVHSLKVAICIIVWRLYFYKDKEKIVNYFRFIRLKILISDFCLVSHQTRLRLS
jgi:hypothetical protein